MPMVVPAHYASQMCKACDPVLKDIRQTQEHFLYVDYGDENRADTTNAINVEASGYRLLACEVSAQSCRSAKQGATEATLKPSRSAAAIPSLEASEDVNSWRYCSASAEYHRVASHVFFYAEASCRAGSHRRAAVWQRHQ